MGVDSSFDFRSSYRRFLLTDFGDIANYRAIDPTSRKNARFFRRLKKALHDLDIVMISFPLHTSDQHLVVSRIQIFHATTPKRDYYVWRWKDNSKPVTLAKLLSGGSSRGEF